MGKTLASLQTFELFHSQTLKSCVYRGFIVHGYINKSALKVSELQAPVG